MAKRPKSSRACGSPKYRPSDHEQAAVARFAERIKTSRPPAKYRIEKRPEGVSIQADHAEPQINTVLLVDTFATASTTFAGVLRDQIAQVSRTGATLTDNEMNGMLAMVRAIGPRDETEAMLAVQMAAIHNATMIAARRLNHVELIPQQDSAGSLLVKLSRTFAMQLEALKKHRSTGEQVIKVQHVVVRDGGQAIVGDVVQAQGGVSHEINRQPLAPQATGCEPPAGGTTLLSHQQAVPLPLPIAGGERGDGVQDARRPRWRANGCAERQFPAR